MIRTAAAGALEEKVNMNGKKIKLFRKALPLYIMVLPGFVYLLINNYIPMFGIVIAFKNLNFFERYSEKRLGRLFQF